MIPEMNLTKTEFPEAPPNFLYQILVDEVVHPNQEVFVYGATTMISAAGDLVIQNAEGQRVFGVGHQWWYGFYIVDQETFKPVTQFFETPSND